MANLTLRSVKGSALTNTEIDNNFIDLNSDKAPKGSPTFTGTATFNGTVRVQDSTNTTTQTYSVSVTPTASLSISSASGGEVFRIFSGVGDNATDNTAAFNAAEASTSKWIYLPPGTYRTTHLQLTNIYFGPGSIRFNDGYIQSGLPPGFERPRSASGPLTLTSPNDIVLAPTGDVQLSGKKLLNVQNGVAATDGATVQNITNAISALGTIPVYAEGTFTPSIEGRTTAGTCTYSVRTGRYTRHGRLLTVLVRIDYSGHTGTGQMLIKGMPYTMQDQPYVGNVLTGSYNRGATTSLACALSAVDNAIQIVQDIPNTGVSVASIDSDGSASITLTITYEVA